VEFETDFILRGFPDYFTMTSMPSIAVIAGGIAQRMRPLTETVPKALLSVAGEPFIAHQLRLFRREGVDQVVLCVGYLGEKIEEFVGDGNRFGLNVRYSYDGDRRLGTGGAIRKALPLLGNDFLLIYGDSYLDIGFAPIVEAFRSYGSPALMTILHNLGRWDTSNVEFADGRIVDYSKQPTARMAHIDYGLAMLSAAVFADVAMPDEFDLAVLYQRLLAQNQLYGYEVTQRFYEIGSPAGLAETDAYLRLKMRST
jgi:NDP-sugar pyrophosphorylase family protein